MYSATGTPATGTFRVIWALDEPSPLYIINGARPRSPDIKVVNPAREVPALLDVEHCIIGSTAIIQYLSEKHLIRSTLTVPEVILGYCAVWAGRAGFGIPEGRLNRYFERLHARPAFSKALALREAAL